MMETSSAYPPHAPCFTQAQGVWVTDESGHQFLDGCAGTFNIGLGYQHPRVVGAIRRVLESGILHGSGSLGSELRQEAEQSLVAIAPPSLDRCHLKGCSGGSTAVEQALRHAWAVTGRAAIATFELSHHGQTLVTSAISGMEFRKKRIPSPWGPTLHVPPPDCYRCPFGKKPETCSVECIGAIQDQLQTSQQKLGGIAAFLAEPILGAGGGLTPPKNFWSALTEVLTRMQIPLILDEVQTFGRTGEFLAAKYYGIEPRMVCLAKAISGIGVPGAGALLLSQQDCILDEGERSFTWGASNLACAAIVATIETMQSPGFFSSLSKSAEALKERLEGLVNRYDFIGCVRGVGLMTGLEVVRSKASREKDPKLTAHLINACLSNGLLLRQSEYGRGSFLKIRPALTITVDEAEELCRRLDRAIQTVMMV